jgi:FHA domain-containing protein
MPQVTLDLVSLDNKPLSGVSRQFEGNGGTIGRDEGNTLALPDSNRRVSRLHATISFPDGVPTITNSSSVLPISVGGKQLESGQAMPLKPGSSLSIGPYVLMVRPAEVSAPPESAPVSAATIIAGDRPALETRPRTAPAPVASIVPAPPLTPAAGPQVIAPMPKGGDPFADLLSGLGDPAPAASGLAAPDSRVPSNDPLAALLGSAAPGGQHPAVGSPAGHDPFAVLGMGSASADPRLESPVHPQPPRPAAAAAVIPDDFNPFELPSASARNTADPLSSMLGGPAAPAAQALIQEEASIDALFPTGAVPGDEFLSGRQGGAPLGGFAGDASSLLAQPDSMDPLALFAGSSPPRESVINPMRDDLAEVDGAYQPPRALDPVLPVSEPPQPPPKDIFASPMAPAAVARSDSAQVPAMPSAPADALTRAFLTGANLPATALPNGLTPEIMAMVGSLLRSATAGAIEMLAIRASIKREVHANVTIISSEANNPLKFLPNADSVLLQLLGEKMPGFMRADEAMKDAFDDLRAHELGVIAGTRAALDEVLRKFDPTILGDRLIRGSLLEKAVPAMRKTKLWDLYVERYAQMRREVEDDFQSIFGKAFVAAYERETARMKAQNPARGP